MIHKESSYDNLSKTILDLVQFNPTILQMKDKKLQLISRLNEDKSQSEKIVIIRNLREEIISNTNASENSKEQKFQCTSCVLHIYDFKSNLFSTNEDYKCIQTLNWHTGTVNSIIQLKNGKLASADFYTKMWNYKKSSNIFVPGITLKMQSSILEKEIKSVIQSRNGHIVCGNSNNRILFFDPYDEKNHYNHKRYTIKTIGSSKDIVNKKTKHKGSVNTVIQLKNSDLLVSGSNDRTIKIWNPKQNYKCIKTIGGKKDRINTDSRHTDSINALIELEDGQIASASNDQTIKIWNPDQDYKCIHTLSCHTDSVNSLIQLRNGNLVSASNDKSIKIWNPPEEFKCIYTIIGHTSYVNCLIQLNNGLITSGSDDRTIKIWDPNQSYKCIKTFEGHTGSIHSLTQLQNGLLASGSSDKYIKIWQCVGITDVNL